MTSEGHDICRIIDALYKEPLDAESIADICIGECTLNQARSKVGLAPLDFEEANKRVLFYSDEIRHGRLSFAVDPVRERFQNSDVELVREFWQSAQNVFN